MSNFIQQIKNYFFPNKLSNIPTNNNPDIHIKTNESDNKCKSNNNNLDSSNDKKIDENKNNIITDTFNYSPEITFGQMPLLYHNDALGNGWNGLKLSLNFHPTQYFNLEYMLNIEKNKKLFNNYSLNCRTLVPLSSNLFPINLLLIGQKESSRAFSFQSYLNLGKNDTISIMTNNVPKEFDENNYLFMNKNKDNIAFEEEKLNINNENNNNIEIKDKENKTELHNSYSIEYCHEFKRGNVGIKFTNLEPNTINFQFSMYKNLFFGMEFFKNPNMEEKYHFLKANYGIMLKQSPQNKFGFTFNYISSFPLSIINCCYRINENFKLFLNTTFSRNELLKKLGQDKFTAAISSLYKNNFIEMNTELNNKGEVKLSTSFSFNKYIDVLMNVGYDHFSKKKKKIKCFGFGLNIKNNSVEEKMQELIESQRKHLIQSNKYYNNIIKLK